MSKFIGAHVSAQGGVQNAPLNAHAIGASAFALYTKGQRQWFSKPLTKEQVKAFKENCEHCGFVPAQILPHSILLINLGNPDKDAREKSLKAFVDELERCHLLGLTMINFHPGSHLRQVTEEESMMLIASSLNQALGQTEDVTAVLENVAGQGSNLGYTFEQLRFIMEHVDDKSRVGVCLDTCHLYASGYDIVGAYDAVFDEFDRVVGFDNLRGIHLNDTHKALGSRVDRHCPLGEGLLGMSFFERLMKDKRFDGIPIILETTDESRWADEIALLRSLE